MQVSGNALMHYIDSQGVNHVEPCGLPPGADTNPADGACQVYADLNANGVPTTWGCVQDTCTTSCTVWNQPTQPGTTPVGTIYYCGCS